MITIGRETKTCLLCHNEEATGEWQLCVSPDRARVSLLLQVQQAVVWTWLTPSQLRCRNLSLIDNPTARAHNRASECAIPAVCIVTLGAHPIMGKRSHSHDDVKACYVTKMGKELGSFYMALENEVIWLYAKWTEYTALFFDGDCIRLLKKTAPWFFFVIQQSLWEDMLLHAARLLDPERFRGQARLTLRGLPKLIEDKKFADHVTELIDDASEKAQFCRKCRNCLIAHKDLKTVMKAKLLPSGSFEEMKNVLDAIADVLTTVAIHYIGTTYMFELPSPSGGAMALLNALEAASQKSEEKRKRLNANDYRPEDWATRDL